MARIRTFYDELGVERNATAAEIKRAFKEIAKVYHPDKNPAEKQAWAHEQMSRFNFIFETLMNPESRQEYDEIVRKYEEAPSGPRIRRAEREEVALAREYALVSIEILNLSGKFSNCHIKMGVGAIIGGSGAITQMVGYFTRLLDDYAVTLFFSYFFVLIGVVLMVMAIADYFGRGQYKRRIDELEVRRISLRRRMFEAYV